MKIVLDVEEKSPEENTTLYVKNMNFKTDEETLKEVIIFILYYYCFKNKKYLFGLQYLLMKAQL